MNPATLDWYYQSPDFVDWSNPINWESPLARELLSAWLAVPGAMGWGSTTTWRDLQHRYTGTPTNGPTWSTQSPPGGWGSLSFANASSQYVNFGSIGSAALTMAGWVRVDDLSQAYTGIWSFANAGVTRFTVYVKSNGKLAAYVNEVSSNYDGTGAHTLTTGRWYYLSASYSAAAGLAVYLDGILDGSALGSGGMSTTGTITAGTDFGFPTDRYLQGKVASFAVVPSSMPADWHKQIHHESLQGYPTLLRRVPLDALFMEQVAAAGNRRRRILAGACP